MKSTFVWCSSFLVSILLENSYCKLEYHPIENMHHLHYILLLYCLLSWENSHLPLEAYWVRKIHFCRQFPLNLYTNFPLHLHNRIRHVGSPNTAHSKLLPKYWPSIGPFIMISRPWLLPDDLDLDGRLSQPGAVDLSSAPPDLNLAIYLLNNSNLMKITPYSICNMSILSESAAMAQAQGQQTVWRDIISDLLATYHHGRPHI